jgi:4-aminobutyrate aminotransferase-like enzyme
MAAVICKKEISAKLGGYYSTFGGNPVSCAMGIAVLVPGAILAARIHTWNCKQCDFKWIYL